MIVDALFGTGFHGSPRAGAAAADRADQRVPGARSSRSISRRASTRRPARSPAPRFAPTRPSRSTAGKPASYSHLGAFTRARCHRRHRARAHGDGAALATAELLRSVPRRHEATTSTRPGTCSSSGVRPAPTGAPCSLRWPRSARTPATSPSPSRASAWRPWRSRLEPVKRGFDWDDAEEMIMAEAERAAPSPSGRGSAAAPKRSAPGELLERLELPVVLDADALFGLDPVVRAARRVDPACGRARPAARRGSAWVDAHRLRLPAARSSASAASAC